jgi:hypothetical protein
MVLQEFRFANDAKTGLATTFDCIFVEIGLNIPEGGRVARSLPFGEATPPNDSVKDTGQKTPVPIGSATSGITSGSSTLKNIVAEVGGLGKTLLGRPIP